MRNKSDWFHLVCSLSFALVITVLIAFEGSELSSSVLTFGVLAMFFLGLNVNTKATKLFHARVDFLRKELDQEIAKFK